LNGIPAALCAGVAIWCSLGTIGLVGTHAGTRVALLAPWWVLPLSIAAVFGLIRLLRLSSREQAPLFGSSIAILPWFPFPVPAAALLWTGPILTVVWVAVIAGVSFERLSGARGSVLTDPHRAPVVAAVAAFALFGASAVWLSPILPDGDEPHYLILAQSLIKDGDLRIENNHRQGDYLDYSLNAAAPDYLRRGGNGEIYSIHAPGLAFLIAPAMWLLGYPGVVAFLGIVAALSTGLLWTIAYRATDSAASAWFGWACCALTAPLFFQATEVFPDGIAATFLLIGTLPLWDGLARPSTVDLSRLPSKAAHLPAAKDAKVEGPRTKVWRYVLSGASLAVLPWLQTRLAVLAVAAAICVCLRIRSVRQLLAFAAVPALSAALWFGFFVVVYGTPNPTAPYGPYTQTSPANLVRGFPGLLFDQQFGLIPNAPVYGFVAVGVLAAAVKRRRWAWETLALTVPYMAAVGSYQMWWGGTSVPVRLLTPLTLVWGLAAAMVWQNIRARGTRTLGILTLLVSALITVALAGPDHGRLLLNFRDGISLWAEWVNNVLDLPKALPSLFHDDRARLWLKVMIWGAAIGVLWIALRMFGSSSERRSAASFNLTWQATWCAAVALMLACTAAWRVESAEPCTPETAKLNLLAHASSWRTHAFDFDTFRVETTNTLLTTMRIGNDRQRRPAGSSVLFTARDVPPGSYGVRLSSQSAAGTLTVHAGPTPLPLATIPLKTVSESSPDVAFTLPTNVRSLTIDGDAAAVHSGVEVELRTAGDAFNAYGDTAHRAVHYEWGNVFFLDEYAYAEPTGFWVAGGRTSAVVVDAGRLFLRNAPVDNRVTLDFDGNVQQFTLGPGEERLLDLSKVPAKAVRVRITSRSGFRPVALDPKSTDLRYLGCWFEVR
jgi:hypothetical protein